MSDYAVQRLNMVEGQVRANDVSDQRIQAAMLGVARESFVPSQLRSVAYLDGCIEVAKGRFLLDPRSFAKLAQLAEIQADDLVLDVGCASGYSSAILSRLGRRVVALEDDPELVRIATECLKGHDNIDVVQGRLADGAPQRAPFDVIFVNGAVAAAPEALLAQLNEGGRLVVMLHQANRERAHLYIRTNGNLSDRSEFDAHVKILPGFERPAEFVF